jgi:hypothetical protein
MNYGEKWDLGTLKPFIWKFKEGLRSPRLEFISWTKGECQ